MKITPLSSGPPVSAQGVVRPPGSAAGIDQFFALIQFFFRERSAAIEPARTQPVSVSRKDFRPAAPRVVERETEREREPFDGASGAVASVDARQPEPVAREKAEPVDGTVNEVDGEARPDADGNAPKLEEAAKEIVARLRKLLEAIDGEGITFKAAFEELLKILSLLQQVAQSVPPDELRSFFSGLGEEFEGLVGKVKQLLDQMDDRGSAALSAMFRPEAARKVREEKMASVQELAQSLARVLEGAAGNPEASAGTTAIETREISAAALPVEAASRPEAEADPVVRAPVPEEIADPGRKKPDAARVQADPEQIVKDPVATQTGRPQDQGPWVAVTPVQAAAPGADAAGGRTDGETGGITPSGKLSPSAAQALSRDPIRLAPAQVEAVEKIVRMVQMSEGNGGQRLRVRLQPPLLGSLQMDLNVKDGILTGRFHVETPAARAAVMGQVEQLRAALAEQGVEIGSFQVSVEGQERNSGETADDRPKADGTFAAEGTEPEAIGAGAPGASADVYKTTYTDVRG